MAGYFTSSSSTLKMRVEKGLMLPALYVKTLKRGFESSPEHVYFYPRLLDFYNSRQRYDEALELSEEALAHNGQSQLFLFGKSTVLLNMVRLCLPEHLQVHL